ncbi:Fc.00g022220.m01.CDS01 [Cosmosporella sp. VM-42]
MKPSYFFTSVFLPLAASQLLVPLVAHPRPGAQLPLTARPPPGQLPVMPSHDNPQDKVDAYDNPSTQRAVPLSDILGTQRALTTFSSLTRQDADTDSLLSDFAVNTTILAPLNSAIEALPRKPWEDPRDYGALGAKAYDGDDGQDRARENLRRFVEAHLVKASPWGEGDKGETVGGRKLWWEAKDGKRVIMPDGIEVEKVASRVANGELWIIKGVLNYA